MSLEAFFDAMGPMLRGQASPREVETQLATESPSGTANLGFYATLAERNHFKILRDLFGPIRTLALRLDPALWPALVRDYTRKHPATHWDPNRFGALFSDYLAQRREADPAFPAVFEELADYFYTRYRVFSCPDDVGDGFDQRLFVRQYTHAVPDVPDALASDPDLQRFEPSPTLVLIYRPLHETDVRLFHPTVVGLAALARRRGLESMPPVFEALSPQAIDNAESELVRHGVLAPTSSPDSLEDTQA